ncbi:MAG: hypothetical protein Q9222_004561 [Ikaeria aurantiellina]
MGVIRIVVLISQIENAEVVRVISNRLKAYGLQRAREAGIPTHYHNLKKFGEQHPDIQDPLLLRRLYDESLANLVLDKKPDLVVCAGWMHIVSPSFLDPLEKASVPAINLHPALPGAFNGIDAIERAHQAFLQGKVNKTGVMIHYVILEVDEGQPLVVKEININQGESCDQLAERMHKLEWLAIVEGVQLAINNLPDNRTERV